MNKTWVKILIAFVGSGANGALTFSSSQWPQYSSIFVPLVMAVTATMSVLIGWPPSRDEGTK